MTECQSYFLPPAGDYNGAMYGNLHANSDFVKSGDFSAEKTWGFTKPLTDSVAYVANAYLPPTLLSVPHTERNTVPKHQ